MTSQFHSTREYIKSVVAQYELLLQNYEFQPDNHTAFALQAFLVEFPCIKDFDSEGNYVGPVRNENGFAA
jgi:hypothetical protein